MIIARYRRLSAAPPPERELLTIEDDGRAAGWRSTGSAVGRFGGRVADMVAFLADLEEAGRSDVPDKQELPFDASVEALEVGGRTARFAARTAVDGPWAPLVGACRDLLDASVASPVAAIVCIVSGDGRVRLEHRGSAALTIELGSLGLRLTLSRNGIAVARGAAGPSGLGRVEAGPGWSQELATPELDLSGGGALEAIVAFVADDGGVYVPVTLCERVTLEPTI